MFYGFGSNSVLFGYFGKILTKRNQMLQLEKKCHNLESGIQKFHRKFFVLHQKGFPGLKGIGDKLINLEEYQQKLYSISKDKSRFA